MPTEGEGDLAREDYDKALTFYRDNLINLKYDPNHDIQRF